MPKKISYLFFIIVFIQIIFSFFYSSEIINQNNNLYQNQQDFQKLKLEKQDLEKTYSDLSSIYHLNQENSDKNLFFIKNNLNLK